MPDESDQQKHQCEFPGVPLHQSSADLSIQNLWADRVGTQSARD
jgi:hypothetical protein